MGLKDPRTTDALVRQRDRRRAQNLSLFDRLKSPPDWARSLLWLLPDRILGREWVRLPTSKEIVALTFDAGGTDAGLDEILRTLESKGVPATFFITGKWAEVYPGHAQRIASRFPVGNHTFSHPDITRLSDTAIEQQLVEGHRALITVTGHAPRHLFRFPFGASNEHTIRVVNSLGYRCIRWTVGSRGWIGHSAGVTTDEIVQAILERLRPGAIILMHVGGSRGDGSTLDAQALPAVIDGIRSRGYSFVTIERFV